MTSETEGAETKKKPLDLAMRRPHVVFGRQVADDNLRKSHIPGGKEQGHGEEAGS